MIVMTVIIDNYDDYVRLFMLMIMMVYVHHIRFQSILSCISSGTTRDRVGFIDDQQSSIFLCQISQRFVESRVRQDNTYDIYPLTIQRDSHIIATDNDNM